VGELVNFESFKNESANWNVRVVIVDGEPWFVATDVCKALGIGNASLAVNGRERIRGDGSTYWSGGLDDDEKGIVSVNTLGGEQDLLCVSESGVYSLVFQSRKPEAKAFKRWVTHEILPSIRKTGSYNPPQTQMPTHHIPQGFIEAMEYALALAKANVGLQEKVDVLEPKASQFDLLMSGQNAVTVNEFVKAFGHGWGRNKLFAWLRAKKILMDNNNLPYQRYVDAGYMTVREVAKVHGENGTHIHSQPMITPKGIDWLSKLLLNE
jgi:prophage antirepressor-like protein